MILNIHCDGSCYHVDGRMGMGVAFFYNDSEQPFHTIAKGGDHLGSNNEAEYLAVKLAIAKLLTFKRNITGAVIHSDSELVINQLKGLYRINNSLLGEINSQIFNMLDYIKGKSIEFVWVPRTHPRQKIADKLSKKANPYFNEGK